MTKPLPPADLFPTGPTVSPGTGAGAASAAGGAQVQTAAQNAQNQVAAQAAAVTNASSNGADIIPFPNPAGVQTPTPQQPANIPDTPSGPLTSTGVPVPSTTGSPGVPGGSPGPLLTAENSNFAAYAAKAPGVTPEQTVQGQLAGLFANREMNPLWQQAEGVAKQYANSRGLMNSNMAAEAGAQAMFAQAMPIAQQDANTHAARAQQEAGFWQSAGLQAQAGTIQSILQAQGHLEQMVQMSHQGDINSRLQLEQYGYNFQLNEQQNIHQMAQLALQGDIQSALALQKFGFDTELMKQDFGFRTQLMDTELRNALRVGEQSQDHQLEQMRLAQNNQLAQIAAGHQNTLEQIGANGAQQGEAFARDLQQNYLLAVERRTGQFSSEVSTIYATEGLTAQQQQNAVNVARLNYQNDLAFIQAQYSASPSWDPSWASASNLPSVPIPAGLPGGPQGPNDPNNPVPTTTVPPRPSTTTTGTGVKQPDRTTVPPTGTPPPTTAPPTVGPGPRNTPGLRVPGTGVRQR